MSKRIGSRHKVLPMWFLYLIATVAALLYFCAPSSALGQTSNALDAAPEVAAAPTPYIYWTNDTNGSIGRAGKDGTGVNNKFIRAVGGKVQGGGMTVDSQYVYWTSANGGKYGGTATTILRAKLDGTGVNKKFITGAQNPCGVTVNSSFIYWAGDVGSSIGRANLNGTGVDQNFIATGTRVCGVVVTKTHIYWANYGTNWIGRANLDGTGVNLHFIPTSAAAGLAIGGSYIYWVNSSNGSIGRAKIGGTGVNQNFITGLSGEVVFLAVDSAHITGWTGVTGALAPRSGGPTSTAPVLTKASSMAL